MKTKKYLLYFLVASVLTACSSLGLVRSNMNKLELGMSKKQVTQILGKGYIIAEKRIENGVEIEVLSYTSFSDDEYYLFLFADGKLEKWYRELSPKFNINNNK